MYPLNLPNLGPLTYAGALAIQQAVAAMGVGTSGNVYYCDPVNGLDVNYGTSPQQSVQTLPAGYALLKSGNNDVLVLEGNGASGGSARISANFTWAKDACHLIGICSPSMVSQRARIAPPAAATAFASLFTVSGNGCLFQNLSWFHGFAAGVAASICLTVSGQRNAFINCDIEGMGDATSAASATSRSVLLSAGENYFGHCNIGLDTIARTNANASVEISSNAARNVFEHCLFPVDSTDGLQYFLLVNSAAAMDRFVLFKGCNFVAFNGGTAIAEALHLVASSGGMACLDSGCGMYNVAAVGGAATKAQTFVSGATSTGGVRGIVAS